MSFEPAGSDERFEANFALQSSHISTSFLICSLALRCNRVHPRHKYLAAGKTCFCDNQLFQRTLASQLHSEVKLKSKAAADVPCGSSEMRTPMHRYMAKFLAGFRLPGVT